MKIDELAFIVQKAGIVHQYRIQIKRKTLKQKRTEKRLAKWGISLIAVSRADYEESKKIFEEYKIKYSDVIDEAKWNFNDLVEILVTAKRYRCDTVEKALKY